MKTISLRQFRDSVADLTEPVVVQRRDADGVFHVLGEWRPITDGAAKRAAYIDVPDFGQQLASKGGPNNEAERMAGFGSPKAAPKPGRKS